MSEPKQILIDPYSAAAVPIAMKWNDQTLGTATGFFWQRDTTKFLVSNWHVFSGRDPRSGQPKNPHGAIPNMLQFPAYSSDNLTSTVIVEAGLVNSNDEPIWMQHVSHGQRVDVAVLPLRNDAFGALTVYPVNTLHQTPEIAVGIGIDVFILGFPLGLRKTHTFPIWKRGSIATEFGFDIDELPCFMVDTATREGMSGAPVIIRTSSYQTSQGNFAIAVGPATKFLGIYSGRHIGGIDEAQLGIVWRSTVIDDIIDNPARGTFELRPA